MLRRLRNKVTLHDTPVFSLLAGIGLVVTGFLFLTAADPQLFAEESASKSADSLLKELQMTDDSFVYSMEGRHDPFVPFLTDKAKVEPAAAEHQENLVGMRKFEPGQLTLVAIVLRNKDNLAMVQDPAGRGYVIRKGTKIGRFGVVENIAPNEVIVQNITFTRTGEKRSNRVEMLLRQGGEEK